MIPEIRLGVHIKPGYDSGVDVTRTYKIRL